MYAIGRSPSSIAEAFFNSSTSSGRGDGVGQKQRSSANAQSGPDAVVSFLSDDIVAAAFEHARQMRYKLLLSTASCIALVFYRVLPPVQASRCT